MINNNSVNTRIKCGCTIPEPKYPRFNYTNDKLQIILFQLQHLRSVALATLYVIQVSLMRASL